MAEEASSSSGGSSGSGGGGAASAASSMAAFVPATVSSCDRLASQVASRVTAPVRSVASRALSFADRIMGTWSGGGSAFAAEPQEMDGAFSGALTVAEPWYSEPATTTEVDPSWDGISGFKPTFSRPVSSASSRGKSIARTAVTAPPVRSKPAAPELNAVTLSVEDIARELATMSPETVAPSRKTSEPAKVEPPKPKAETKPQPATTATASTSQAPVDDVRAAEALGLMPVAAPSSSSSEERASARPSLAAPRSPLARALGHTAWVDSQLRSVAPSPESLARAEGGNVFVAGEPARVAAPAMPPLAVSTSERPTVDAAATAARAATANPAATANSAAPTNPAAPTTRAPAVSPTIATPATATNTPAANVAASTTAASTTAPASAAASTTAGATNVATTAPATRAPSSSETASSLPLVAPGRASTASWTPAVPSALPNPGLSSQLPPAVTTTTDRLTQFLASLVGTQTAADAAPLPVEGPRAQAASTRAPSRELLTSRAADDLARPSLTAPMSRALDASVAPPTQSTTAPSSSRAVSPSMPIVTAPPAVAPSSATESPSSAAASTFVSPSMPLVTAPPVAASRGGETARASSSAPQRAAGAPETASFRPGAMAARSEQLGGSVDARISAAWGAPSSSAPASQTPSLVTSPAEAAPQARAATGPARMAQFLDGLVGVQAVRAAAPLPVVDTTSAPSAAAGDAETTAPLAASRRAPERVSLAASFDRDADDARVETTPARAANFTAADDGRAAATAPGGVGVRAEQMAGQVGTRAAGLSLDFVDPSRLSALSSSSPSMPTIQPEREPDTIMPAPRPRDPQAGAPSASAPKSPMMSAEEWALVATFPSASTAIQMMAARQAAQWQPEQLSPERLASSGPQMLLTERPEMFSDATTTQPAHYASPAADERRAAPSMDLVTAPVVPAEDRVQLPGGRQPRGSYTWPKLASTEAADSPTFIDQWTPAATAVAESGTHAAPGMPMWGTMQPLITVAPQLAAEQALAAASPAGAPSATASHAPAMTQLTAGASLGESNANSSTGAANAGAANASATNASAANASANAIASTASLNASAANAGATNANAGEAAEAPSLANASDAPSMTLATALPPETRALVEAAQSGAAGPGARAQSSTGASSAAQAGSGSNAGSASNTAGSASNAGSAANAASHASAERAANLMRAVAIGGTPSAETSPANGERTVDRTGEGRRRGAPEMSIVEPPRQPQQPPVSGAAARALELARPFLRLVGGGNEAAKPAANLPRFLEQPQPVVGGSPSSEAARQMMSAATSHPATSSDDRISLADMTLISMASATGQIAASAEGAAPAPASSAGADHSGGDAPKAGGADADPSQDVEDLARQAFEELQRLIAIARERSGDPWES